MDKIEKIKSKIKEQIGLGNLAMQLESDEDIKSEWKQYSQGLKDALSIIEGGKKETSVLSTVCCGWLYPKYNNENKMDRIPKKILDGMEEHNNNSGYPELEVKHHPDFTWTICPNCHKSYEINYYGLVEVFEKWHARPTIMTYLIVFMLGMFFEIWLESIL